MLRKLVLLGMVGMMMACCCSLPVLSRGAQETVEGFGIWQNVRGKGPVVVEERALPDFSKLDFLGEGNVNIQVGEQPGVRVEAQENLLGYLETRVEGDTLRISTRNDANLYATEPIRFYVTVDELDFIRLSGSGNIYTEALSVDRLEASLIGSGDIRVAALDAEQLILHLVGSGEFELDDVNVGEINADISGSGNMRIHRGAVDTQEIQIAGSGNYDARDLSSQDRGCEDPRHRIRYAARQRSAFDHDLWQRRRALLWQPDSGTDCCGLRFGSPAWKVDGW